MIRNIDPNMPVTLTFKQIIDLTTRNTEIVLNKLGYDKYIHRTELERTTGWTRRRVDSLIHKEKLHIQTCSDLGRTNKTWFLRSEIAQILAEE